MSRKIKDDWIREYLRFTENHESPVSFNVWIALCLIGIVCERKVYIDFGHYKVYPNMYVVLVSDPGVCKKSAAIGIGTDLLKAIPNPPKDFSQKGTPEALIKRLRSGAEVDDTVIKFLPCSAYIKSSELSTFLGKMSYESGLLSLLTDLYDCPDDWTYETVHKGKQQLENVYLSLLGATTPKWLNQSIPSEAVGGGFLSRTILVYAARPKKVVPWPSLDNSLNEVRKNLIHDLEHISKLKGEMIATKAARDWYSQWYHREMQDMQENDMGELLARRPLHLLKVAMNLSLAERDDLQIDVSHFEKALSALDNIKRTLGYSVEGIETSVSNEVIARVLKIIQRHGQVSHRQLQRTVWRYASADTLDMAIRTLDDSGLIKIHDGAKIRYYKYAGEGDPEEDMRAFSVSEKEEE